MAAATTKMAALNSATSSNAIDPNAEDNCDDAETGNAQESNGYEELPELQAVATCPLPKPRCSPGSVTNDADEAAMQPCTRAPRE